ncbi:MAG: hypothetical protein ACRDRS_13530 [Pseudonocardiaceae bacterium]
MSDLVVDLADFRHHDSAHHTLAAKNEIVVTQQVESLFADIFGQENSDGGMLSPSVLSRGVAVLARRLEEIDFVELTRVIVMWTQRLRFRREPPRAAVQAERGIDARDRRAVF